MKADLENAVKKYCKEAIQKSAPVISLFTTAKFMDYDIDVYGSPEEPWFMAKNVAEWIDYAKSGNGSYNITMMLQSISPEEKAKFTTNNLGRETWFLSEYGLYETLMLGRSPIAKQFKKGVKDILRQIRKTGYYVSPDEECPDAYILMQQARQLYESRKALIKHEKRITKVENDVSVIQVDVQELKSDRDEAKKQIAALEQPKALAPEVPVRGKIQQMVASYVQEHSLSYPVVWGKLYSDFRCIYHKDLKALSKNRKMKPLDYAEQEGLLDDLYSVAYNIVNEKKDRPTWKGVSYHTLFLSKQNTYD